MEARPALVSVERGRVQALILVEKDGILAVPTDRGHRYIGDVFKDQLQVNGLTRTRWFAYTITGATLGPFDQRNHAVTGLLEATHMREADVSETTSPLF